MEIKTLILSGLLATSLFSGANSTANNELKAVKNLAEKFVQLIDKNDADQLKTIMHPDMLQYTVLDGKLIPFKGTDFIQMVADKKLGGKPRKITHKLAEVIRGDVAYVVLNAVSSEYDFMYQLSIAKQNGNWIIVGILVDIVKA